jgi:hypothetical protein
MVSGVDKGRQISASPNPLLKGTSDDRYPSNSITGYRFKPMYAEV